MIVKDDALLASYRRRGKCEWCGKTVNLIAAHAFSRGSGRIDLPWNLVSLGADAVRDCTCHHDSHYQGWPGTDELLTVIASRYAGLLQDDIRDMRNLVLRQPKGSSIEQLEAALVDLSPRARELMRETLFVKIVEAT